MQHRAITKASDIKRWADTVSARSELPRLIRRLILATNKSCKQIHFPCGEQVQRPGFDGTATCRDATAYVPKGPSAWEMGVDANPKGKADDDFLKRNAKLPSNSDVAFLFVTPRQWQKKDQWVKSVGASSKFSDVRAYDCADLEGWLETAPAVDLWFAEQIGIKPYGAIDLATYWKVLRASTRPPLPPEVFLCSRSEAVSSLEAWIGGGPKDLAFSAYSPEEVLDFYVSWVESLPEDRREQLQARSIIVTKPEAWDSYAARQVQDHGLILIAHHGLSLNQGMIADAVANGHHVLLPVRGLFEEFQGQPLRRAFQYELVEALKKGGLDDDGAHRHAKDCGGSTTVLKRLLRSTSHRDRPVWATSAAIRGLVRLVLAGSWNGDNDADRKVIEVLSGKSYADAIAPLQQLADAEEAPFLRSGSVWSQATRIPLWDLIVHHITPDDMAAFKSTCMQVLGEIDPTIDLSEQERWLAPIKRIGLRFSTALRKGVVESLALMGAGDSGTNKAELRRFAGEAHMVIRELLFDKDSRQWLSLQPFFLLLAEAAPDAFLEAVEKDLRSQEPNCHAFFTDSKESKTMFPHSSHTNLLWALECLAWSPRYLTRSALLLAKLTELDPGGQLANRPAASLLSLFRAWHPETSASIDQRMDSLRAVIERHPKVGRDLLLNLLPGRHDMAMNNPRPSIRTWHMDQEKITRGDAVTMWREAFRLLLNRANAEPGVVIELLSIYPQLDKSDAADFEQMLKAIAQHEASPDTRSLIWEGVMDEIRKHRAHKNAKWAMSEDLLDRLQAIADSLKPSDPVLLSKHLFDRNAIHRLTDDVEDSASRWDTRRQLLASSQLTVLQSICDVAGLPELLRMIDLVEDPHTLGILLGLNGLIEPTTLIPAELESDIDPRRVAASAFVVGFTAKVGYDWIDTLDLSSWSTEAMTKLLLALGMNGSVWDRLHRFPPEVVANYWREVGGLIFEPGGEFTRGNDLLLANGRPDAVIHNLGMRSRDSTLDDKCAMKALDELLAGMASGNLTAERVGSIHYEIQELFGLLQKSEHCDRSALARLEFAFLSFLDGHGGEPRILHEMMAVDPGFFLDVFRIAYGLPTSDESTEVEPVAEQERSRALQAHRLLHSWHRIPSMIDGAIDQDALFTWFEIVRAAAEEWSRLPLCDSLLGEVLSHAPGDPEGFWPCGPVCELMELLSSAELESGMLVGIRNQRGVFSKALYEGGDQERNLAASYRTKAELIEARFPRAARVLHLVAESYEHDATREDQRRRWD